MFEIVDFFKSKFSHVVSQFSIQFSRCIARCFRSLSHPPRSRRFRLPASSALVGSSGIEPPPSRFSGVRSNHLSYEPTSGGDEEVRTPDPLRARQVLSQLSYTPICGAAPDPCRFALKSLPRAFKIKQCSLPILLTLRSVRVCTHTASPFSLERR